MDFDKTVDAAKKEEEKLSPLEIESRVKKIINPQSAFNSPSRVSTSSLPISARVKIFSSKVVEVDFTGKLKADVNELEGNYSDFGLVLDINNQKSCDIEHGIDDEGEKISSLLDKAAKPEVLMAKTTSKQLTSVASYQARTEMHIATKRALRKAGLSWNEVNTLLRVRFVCLTSETYIHKTSLPQGLIIIWIPTEKQQ